MESDISSAHPQAASSHEEVSALGRLRTPAVQRLLRQASRRIGWGVADQGMSSLTNFAVAIYIARTLGAVQFGAFSLAYVTYSFSLNASRGLGTDPFLVRFSGTEHPIWRRAVSHCTGTAAIVGLAAGSLVLVAAMILHGTTRAAFLALGLTMPGLTLQDSWRFSFFAQGRGSQAFLNDTVWAVVLFPALIILKAVGHADVFWFVFAWGASACIAAAIGPFQAGVTPRLAKAWGWMYRHRDLGPRYLAEGTSNAGLHLAVQLRYRGHPGPGRCRLRASGQHAHGPVHDRLLRDGPSHLARGCPGAAPLTPAPAVVLPARQRRVALMALAWGVVLLVALPRGLGELLLRNLWRPTYKLVLPGTIGVIGGCVSAGAGTGIHALGIARRSLWAMAMSSAIAVVLGLAGAFVGGAVGTMYGAAIAAWIGALLFWLQLRRALYETGHIKGGHSPRFRRRPEDDRGWHGSVDRAESPP